MTTETRLYPPTVFSYNHLDESGRALPGHGEVCREIPYFAYHEAMTQRKVGDIIRTHAGAPGIGYTEHCITRMDETGIYAVCVANTMRMMSAEDVR